MLKGRTRAVSNFAILLVSVVTVELALRSLGTPSYVLPRPSDIVVELARSRGVLASHAAVTFSEALGGLFVATCSSLAIALPASVFLRARAPVSSALVLVQSTPVIALGPILSAWMGPGIGAKVVLSGLVCLPAIATTLLAGLTNCSPEEVQLYTSMGANKFQLLRHLRLPRAVPAFFTAMSIGIPLAMLGAVVGEFVGASHGLGFYIMTASYYLRTDQMFSAIVVTAAGSILTVRVVRLIRMRVSWERFEVEGLE